MYAGQFSDETEDFSEFEVYQALKEIGAIRLQKKLDILASEKSKAEENLAEINTEIDEFCAALRKIKE